MVQNEKIDVDLLPLDDEHTWDLFCNGQTIGIFQCESKLVRDWLKKIKPRNIWELSVIIAGVRPGSLQSGAMDSYLNNKDILSGAKQGDIEKFNHPDIDKILESTNFNIFFQEQLLNLAQRVAWKHYDDNKKNSKSDDLRKAVGKKDSAKILEIGKEFTEGCIKNGVSQEIAERLFEIIKNSGRYSFNLSHAVSYAFVSYSTAFLKTHYPQYFYTVYLSYSDEKMNPHYELNKLVQDLKRTGYKILPPDINQKNLDFERVGDDSIRFGLSYIKFFRQDYKQHLENLKKIENWKHFIEFIANEEWSPGLPFINSLIFTGAFDSIESANKLYVVAQLVKLLTEKECRGLLKILPEYDIIDQCPAMIERVGVEFSVKKRKDLIISEAKILDRMMKEKPNEFWLERKQKEACGTILSTGVLGDLERYSTMNCIELLQQEDMEDSKQRLVCVIDSVQSHTIKTGKNKGKEMAKLAVHDSSGELSELPIFADKFQKYKELLFEDNIVQLTLVNKNGKWLINDVTKI